MEWVERVYAGDRICFGWEPPEPWNAESLGAVIQADGPADWATMAWATHPRPKRAFEWLTPEALARYGPLARELATVWRDAPHFARYGACLEEAVTTLERETATVAVTVCAPEEPFVAQTLACAAVILEVERDALRVGGLGDARRGVVADHRVERGHQHERVVHIPIDFVFVDLNTVHAMLNEHAAGIF
jgi:hypothetical protein